MYGSSWDFSPACDAVALGGHRGRVLLVDLARGRRTGRTRLRADSAHKRRVWVAGGPQTLTLGSRSAVTQVAWPRPGRLTGLTGPFKSSRVVTVSVPNGRVVSSRRLGGRPWASEATPLGLVVLAAPGDRIGSATLVLANPDGGLLRVPLPRIRAGFHEVNPQRLARQVAPGLAVDATAGRAYAVAANEPLVAEVDLASGAVTYHRLRGARRRGRAGGRQGALLWRLPGRALDRRRHDRGER